LRRCFADDVGEREREREREREPEREPERERERAPVRDADVRDRSVPTCRVVD
jgi:hypothetical protein